MNFSSKYSNKRLARESEGSAFPKIPHKCSNISSLVPSRILPAVSIN